MRLSFMFLIFAIVLSGCAGSGNHPDNKILAQVGHRELKRQEVASSIPYGLASSDSLLMAEQPSKALRSSCSRNWISLDTSGIPLGRTREARFDHSAGCSMGTDIPSRVLLKRKHMLIAVCLLM